MVKCYIYIYIYIGSEGDLLYFILLGSIGVLIPVGVKAVRPLHTKSRFGPNKHHLREYNQRPQHPEATRLAEKSPSTPGRNNKKTKEKHNRLQRENSFVNISADLITFHQVAILTKGLNFGELALTTNKPRYIYIYIYIILYIYIEQPE